MPQKLFKYISTAYIKSLLLFHLAISVIIFIADFTENIRASGSLNIKHLVILSLIKIPYLIIQISPFILLLASFATIRSMVLKKEVDILKSFGISIWQFLIPFFVISFIWSLIIIIFISPFSVDMLILQEKLSSNNVSTHEFTSTDRYLWIVDKYNKNSNIIATKSLSINKNKTNLYPIIFLEINNDKFKGAIFAKKGEMEKSKITFYNSISKYKDNFYPVKLEKIEKNSYISSKSLTTLSNEPFMIKIWDFPKVIKGLKNISFSSYSYEIYFYNLLTLPLLFITMLLISTRFSLYDVRAGKNLFAIFSCIITGFTIYFFVNFGNVSFVVFNVPAVLAVLLSKVIVFLVAINMLFIKEGL